MLAWPGLDRHRAAQAHQGQLKSERRNHESHIGNSRGGFFIGCIPLVPGSPSSLGVLSQRLDRLRRQFVHVEMAQRLEDVRSWRKLRPD
jgi:hypothetical protein